MWLNLVKETYVLRKIFKILYYFNGNKERNLKTFLCLKLKILEKVFCLKIQVSSENGYVRVALAYNTGG